MYQAHVSVGSVPRLLLLYFFGPTSCLPVSFPWEHIFTRACYLAPTAASGKVTADDGSPQQVTEKTAARLW